MSNVEPLPVPRDHAVAHAGVIEMSVEDWINVPDNPVQRDTARRARKAKHLHVLDPVHQEVRMARLPDASCIKLDGHTRALLWNGGLAHENIQPKRPEYVVATVYECQTREDAKRLYDKFNSRASVKTWQDEVQGAHRELDLHFESSLLRAGRYGMAVRSLYELLYRVAYQTTPTFTRRCVEEFAPELRFLDRCVPSKADFPVAVTMAALATIRDSGSPAVEFWDRYAKDAGYKGDGERDPVQALRETVQTAREQKRLSKQFYLELMGPAAAAVAMDQRGGIYKKKKGIGTGEKKLAALLDRLRAS